MKTIKEVSDLTGVSRRMLYYYDEINLLKPSQVTEAGYRLYSNKDILKIQEILFLKEIEIPLKEIQSVIEKEKLDKYEIIREQRRLIELKRERLDNLLTIIDKKLENKEEIKFKAFDMSEYYKALENFKEREKELIIDRYGSLDKFNEIIEKSKEMEIKLGRNVIDNYGSIERYVGQVEETLNNEKLLEVGRGCAKFKKDLLEERNIELINLYKELTLDLNKNPESTKIQKIAKEISEKVRRDYKIFREDKHWYGVQVEFRLNQEFIERFENKFGKDSAKFVTEVFKVYLKQKKPKLEKLYEELETLSEEEPTSIKVQNTVKRIEETMRENNKSYGREENYNYKAFFKGMAKVYLNSDNKKFIGKAFEYYVKG